MAKSDFICATCKKVKGSDGYGNPTSKYKCLKHKFICRDCVAVNTTLFLGRVKNRECKHRKGEVLPYEYNSSKNRWEKV
jgi:hypothetical protein